MVCQIHLHLVLRLHPVSLRSRSYEQAEQASLTLTIVLKNNTDVLDSTLKI